MQLLRNVSPYRFQEEKWSAVVSFGSSSLYLVTAGATGTTINGVAAKPRRQKH